MEKLYLENFAMNIIKSPLKIAVFVRLQQQLEGVAPEASLLLVTLRRRPCAAAWNR